MRCVLRDYFVGTRDSSCATGCYRLRYIFRRIGVNERYIPRAVNDFMEAYRLIELGDTRRDEGVLKNSIVSMLYALRKIIKGERELSPSILQMTIDTNAKIGEIEKMIAPGVKGINTIVNFAGDYGGRLFTEIARYGEGDTRIAEKIGTALARLFVLSDLVRDFQEDRGKLLRGREDFNYVVGLRNDEIRKLGELLSPDLIPRVDVKSGDFHPTNPPVAITLSYLFLPLLFDCGDSPKESCEACGDQTLDCCSPFGECGKLWGCE